MDHALKCIVEVFLKGVEGEAAARELLTAVRKGLETYTLSKYDLTEMLAALFKVQPRAALEILVGDESDEESAHVRRHALAGGVRSSALVGIPIDVLLEWCGEGSPQRWAHVAPLLPAFAQKTEVGGVQWSKEVLSLLTQAPEPINVAEALVELIEPMGWSGSRAEAIKQRLPLLDELARVLGPAHEGQIMIWRGKINRTIERETRRELDEHRASNERFE
jgi:hypothetical protein